MTQPPLQGSLSKQVVQLTGCSFRQLQWWDEQNVIVPIQDLHRRIYSPAQVFEVALTAALRRRGLSLQKLRRMMRNMPVDHPMYLVTDGKKFWWPKTGEGALELVAASVRPVLVVDLVKIREKVRDRVETLEVKAPTVRRPPVRSGYEVVNSRMERAW